MRLIGCWIHGCNSGSTENAAVRALNSDSFSSTTILNCIISGNTLDGINFDAGTRITIMNCTLDSNAGDNIEMTGTLTTRTAPCIMNNILTKSTGGYGIRALTNTEMTENGVLINYNAFGFGTYANSSGTVTPTTITRPNDVTLATGDPYTSSGGFNFGILASSAAQNAGFPQTIKGSATDANLNIGAAQQAYAAGGGSTSYVIGG